MVSRADGNGAPTPISADEDDDFIEEQSPEEDEFDCLIDVLLRRLYREETVDWDDYYRLYPQHAERLKDLKPVMEAVVQVLRDKWK